LGLGPAIKKVEANQKIRSPKPFQYNMSHIEADFEEYRILHDRIKYEMAREDYGPTHSFGWYDRDIEQSEAYWYSLPDGTEVLATVTSMGLEYMLKTLEMGAWPKSYEWRGRLTAFLRQNSVSVPDVNEKYKIFCGQIGKCIRDRIPYPCAKCRSNSALARRK
jgi:hypothetical protein